MRPVHIEQRVTQRNGKGYNPQLAMGYRVAISKMNSHMSPEGPATHSAPPAAPAASGADSSHPNALDEGSCARAVGAQQPPKAHTSSAANREDGIAVRRDKRPSLPKMDPARWVFNRGPAAPPASYAPPRPAELVVSVPWLRVYVARSVLDRSSYLSGPKVWNTY